MRRMFSENQVKELVKQAIASGEIKIGSKLYLHYYDNNENGSYISFIAPFSKPIDLETLVDAFYDSKISNLVLCDTLDNKGMAIGVAIDEEDTNFIYGNCATADETLSISVTSQDLVNLSVTPLN